MADIFEDWKSQRFIAAPDTLVGQLPSSCSKLIILTDVSFWNGNYEELKDWCDQNDCTTQGMTVMAKNSHALTTFCLRWA
jgi:hypothetical protein